MDNNTFIIKHKITGTQYRLMEGMAQLSQEIKTKALINKSFHLETEL